MNFSGSYFASAGSGQSYFWFSSASSAVVYDDGGFDFNGNNVTNINRVIYHNGVERRSATNPVDPASHPISQLSPSIQTNVTAGPRPEPVPRLTVRLNESEGATASEMSSTAGQGAAGRREAMGGAHSTGPAQRGPKGKQASAVGRCEEEGCGASLASWAQYVQHLEVQHGYDFARFCDICLKDTQDKKLENHRRLHFRKNWAKVECQLCDAKFFSAAAGEEHVRGFHEGRAAEQ